MKVSLPPTGMSSATYDFSIVISRPSQPDNVASTLFAATTSVAPKSSAAPTAYARFLAPQPVTLNMSVYSFRYFDQQPNPRAHENPFARTTKLDQAAGAVTWRVRNCATRRASAGCAFARYAR